MSYFIRKQNTFFVTDSTDIHTKLPVGNYAVRFNQSSGLYLEEIDDFTLPTKLYGTITNDAERIFNTFNDRKQSTGVLLVGEKGSGKTLLAKQLSMLGTQVGAPTIVVNEPFAGDSFNKLIQAIDGEAIILFDEFEKVYREEKHQQESMLTLLDGVYPTKKLFILTCNNQWATDKHLWNRPGRIFYLIKFGGLNRSFIQEYCDLNLKHKHRMEQLLTVTNMFTSINFDMLQSVVEEVNRYDENPKDLLRMLNMKHEFDHDAKYDVNIMIDNKELNRDSITTKVWDGNPAKIHDDDDIVIYIRVPASVLKDDDDIDMNLLYRFYEENPIVAPEIRMKTIPLYFTGNDVSAFKPNGVVHFRNEHKDELILTRQTKPFNW